MKKNTPKYRLGNILIAACLSVSAYTSMSDDSEKHGMTKSTIFDIREHGAAGDGKTLDSPAINRAIEAASLVGGGTVHIPAGTYLSGSIRLKSKINLHLAPGAVILGAPQEMNAYDETEDFIPPAYQDGGHTYFRNSLIWGENLTDVSISGQGMINGGGMTSWNPVLDKMAGCASEGMLSPPPKDENGKTLPNGGMPPVRRGNKAVALKLCKNVLIRDVTIYHGGHFAILATGCDNMTIDNVTIDTNRDGIDIDCCHNVMVSNCRVNAPMDDAICPKSSYALGEIRLTENLVITNCQVSGFEEGTLIDGTMKSGPKNWGVGRIKFGTETSGGFRNVAISNCVFRNSMGLALQMVDGGIMENVVISNIAMTDVKKYGMFITTGKRNRTPALKTNSRMKNILISNVVLDGVDSRAGIIITGLPEQPIEDIRIENIRLTSNGGETKDFSGKKVPEAANGYPKPDWAGTIPAYGIFARHVKGLELANIKFSLKADDTRPAAMFEDVDGLEISNLKAQTANGVLGAVFSDDVKNVTTHNSPEFEKKKTE